MGELSGTLSGGAVNRQSLPWQTHSGLNGLERSGRYTVKARLKTKTNIAYNEWGGESNGKLKLLTTGKTMKVQSLMDDSTCGQLQIHYTGTSPHKHSSWHNLIGISKQLKPLHNQCYVTSLNSHYMGNYHISVVNLDWLLDHLLQYCANTQLDICTLGLWKPNCLLTQQLRPVHQYGFKLQLLYKYRKSCCHRNTTGLYSLHQGYRKYV